MLSWHGNKVMLLALVSLFGYDFGESNSSENSLDMFSKSSIVRNTGVFRTPVLSAGGPLECN